MRRPDAANASCAAATQRGRAARRDAGAAARREVDRERFTPQPGVYLTDGTDPAVFRHVAAPGAAELQALVQNIAERIGRLLEKRGLIERDAENAWLSRSPEQAGSLDYLIGHYITYRIAVEPHAGQKLLTLQTVPAQGDGEIPQRAMRLRG